MNLITANINNITELWETCGSSSGHVFATEDYTISMVNGSDWPNRLWFNNKATKKMVDAIEGKWDLRDITVVAWGHELPAVEALLKGYGFAEKSELTGMSMKLDNIPWQPQRLRIGTVDSRETAVEWSALFNKAFGYYIHEDIVYQTMTEIDYFIGRMEGAAVGIASLFVNNSGVAGIYSMGIVPGYRRMGYAKDMLLYTLHTAKKKAAVYATLQASAMGEGLYLKTGFKEDFKLKNFVKK